MGFKLRNDFVQLSNTVPSEGLQCIQVLKVEDREEWQAWQVTAKTIPQGTQGDSITFTFTQSYRGCETDDQAYTWAKRFLDALFISQAADGSWDLTSATKQIRWGLVSHWENLGKDGRSYTNANFRFEYEGAPADGVLRPVESDDLKWLNKDDFDERFLPAPA